MENRIHRDVFASEFEEAVKVLSLLPGAGTPYMAASIVGVRRIYLRKIATHLYYTFDEQEVIVRAVWGARRRHGPKLKS